MSATPLLVWCLAWAVSGCGSESEDMPHTPTTPCAQESCTQEADAGLPTGGDDSSGDVSVLADSGQPRTDGGGRVESACAVTPIELGELKLQQTGDKHWSLWKAEGFSSPLCTSGRGSEAARVLRFRAAAKGVLTVRASQVSAGSGPVLDLRAGDCGPKTGGAGAVSHCAKTGTLSTVVEPGEDYYLWVVGSPGTVGDTFGVRYRLEQMQCQLSSAGTCKDGVRSTCRDPSVKPVRGACAGGSCADASRCGGDKCADAVAVDLGSAPVRLSGDQPGYSHRWNGADVDGCRIGGGGKTEDTTGVDAFFRLQSVAKGDELVFDAQGSDTELAFYVLDGCGTSKCEATGVYDADGDNRFTWTSTVSGDVIVVAESLTPPNRDGFQFEVRRK